MELTYRHQKAIQVNNFGWTQQVRDGRNYLILPVVMMVEGVHNGSHGPVLHAAEELSKRVDDWNGSPVTIEHPQDGDGNFISASDPIARGTGVGLVQNAKWEDGKLKAEVWLDEQKTIAQSPLAMQHINENKPLEVSVGVFTEEEITEGDWNGETYTAIAHNHKPDHLALLPGGVGACSWADGCGIRVNKDNTNEQKGGKMKDVFQTLKQLNAKGYSTALIQNAEGYMAVLEKIQTKLNAKDRENRYHYVEEVYEGYFVYRASGGDEPSRLYRQNYSVNASEEVEFSGDADEVRKKVEYVTLSEGMKRTKFNNNSNEKKEVNMSDEKKAPCGNCMEKVVALINNKQTHFTKSDREWLLEQDEEKLDKLFPKDPEPIQVNREQALEALKDVLNDSEELVKILPDGPVKTQIETGLKLHKEERETLIKEIQANTDEGTWEKADLEVMSSDMLRKIAKSVEPKGDYSGQGGGTTIVVNEGEEALLPPEVEIK